MAKKMYVKVGGVLGKSEGMWHEKSGEQELAAFPGRKGAVLRCTGQLVAGSPEAHNKKKDGAPYCEACQSGKTLNASSNPLTAMQRARIHKRH